MLAFTINRRVLSRVTPIAIGYLAIGLADGILGQKAGLAPLEMFLMSVLAYAGSSQFIGIAMMIQQASYLSIFLTIFVVNLRYVLFSSALAPYLSHKSTPYLSFFAHGITDETFAVNLDAFQNEKTEPWTEQEALALDWLGCFSWAISNAIGCYASSFFNINLALVSYILTAMFLGIWANYLCTRPLICVGIGSGLLAAFLSQIVPYKLHIVLASLIASAIGAYCYDRFSKGDKVNGQ